MEESPIGSVDKDSENFNNAVIEKRHDMAPSIPGLSSINNNPSQPGGKSHSRKDGGYLKKLLHKSDIPE